MRSFLKALPGAVVLFAVGSLAEADDWPQWRGPQRDGIWRETGIVEKLPPELKYRWKTDIGGGFAGPAVVGRRVYVTDRVVTAGQLVPESRWNVTDPVRGSIRS